MITIEGKLSNHAMVTDRAKGWDLVFYLEPWRRVDGAWNETPVYVYAPAGTEAKAKGLARQYRKGNAVRVAVASVRPQGDYVARAAGKLPVKKIAIAKAPKTARTTYRDAVLGRLELEAAFDWVATRRKLGGSSVELAIDVANPDDEAAIAKTIVKARAAVKLCERKLDAIRDAVTEKLLPLYNAKWRPKGRPELAAPAFRAKVAKPSELHVEARVTTLRFHASGLFTDHAIEVRMTGGGRIATISIA